MFDCHKRISYYRFLHIEKYLPQKGGGSNRFNKLKIFQLEQSQIERILYDLVSNDYQDISIIINKYF